MKTLKVTRPALEASLPKYSCIQKLNFVIPIFDNIFPCTDAIHRVSTDDLNQIPIFTAQYVAYRQKSPLDPAVSTYLHPLPAPATAPAAAPATAPATAPAAPFIIQPVFYSIPRLPITHTRVTRQMIIKSLPLLTTDEKLNLILAVYDNITPAECNFDELIKIMTDYVRFAIRSCAKKT